MSLAVELHIDFGSSNGHAHKKEEGDTIPTLAIYTCLYVSYLVLAFELLVAETNVRSGNGKEVSRVGK